MANFTKFLFTLVLLIVFSNCSLQTQKKPDIFLIIIDTLRADHLGCYGYERNTSPTIDSLAASGILFSSFQAQSPWTLPSHASIWTGLTPKSHMAGMRNNSSYGLDENLETIASLLQNDGYVTLGFVNVILISHVYGFDHGFNHYSSFNDGHGRASITVDEVLNWFDENSLNPYPKFTIIHLYDVHSPFDPPAPFDTYYAENGTDGETEWLEDSLGFLQNPASKDHLINLYDGEIAWVDNQLGRLFSELRKTGVSDNAYFIITSDHGEEFLEHGYWSHGHSLYQELLHVPLIISGPDIAPGVVNSSSSGHFDILPTILGFTNTSVPDWVEGEDLFNLQATDRLIPSSGAIASLKICNNPRELESLCSVFNGSDKAIFSFYSMEKQFFNLRVDPNENTVLVLPKTFINELENYWLTLPVGNPTVIEESAAQENLRSLGYIK